MSNQCPKCSYDPFMDEVAAPFYEIPGLKIQEVTNHEDNLKEPENPPGPCRKYLLFEFIFSQIPDETTLSSILRFLEIHDLIYGNACGPRIKRWAKNVLAIIDQDDNGDPVEGPEIEITEPGLRFVIDFIRYKFKPE